MILVLREEHFRTENPIIFRDGKHRTGECSLYSVRMDKRNEMKMMILFHELFICIEWVIFFTSFGQEDQRKRKLIQKKLGMIVYCSTLTICMYMYCLFQKPGWGSRGGRSWKISYMATWFHHLITLIKLRSQSLLLRMIPLFIILYWMQHETNCK